MAARSLPSVPRSGFSQLGVVEMIAATRWWQVKSSIPKTVAVQLYGRLWRAVSISRARIFHPENRTALAQINNNPIPAQRVEGNGLTINRCSTEHEVILSNFLYKNTVSEKSFRVNSPSGDNIFSGKYLKAFVTMQCKYHVFYLLAYFSQISNITLRTAREP